MPLLRSAHSILSRTSTLLSNRKELPSIFNTVRTINSDSTIVEPPNLEPTIPPYEEKFGEPLPVKRARLLYQSRKRGMLENDLLLSGYASKYLSTMDEPLLSQYDKLINQPSNDWEIYYWATGVKETPAEFDSDVLRSLKDYVKNEDKEDRTRMPNLY